jgi:hypothetical protein
MNNVERNLDVVKYYRTKSTLVFIRKSGSEPMLRMAEKINNGGKDKEKYRSCGKMMEQASRDWSRPNLFFQFISHMRARHRRGSTAVVLLRVLSYFEYYPIS